MNKIIFLLFLCCACQTKSKVNREVIVHKELILNLDFDSAKKQLTSGRYYANMPLDSFDRITLERTKQVQKYEEKYSPKKFLYLSGLDLGNGVVMPFYPVTRVPSATTTKLRDYTMAFSSDFYYANLKLENNDNGKSFNEKREILKELITKKIKRKPLMCIGWWVWCFDSYYVAITNDAWGFDLRLLGEDCPCLNSNSRSH